MSSLDFQDAKPLEGTVFIVDDDGDIRDGVSLLVQSVGLSAEVFSSADEFIEHYEPTQQGCLVLDIRMPGMSGLELQAKLDADRLWPPIIFISAHGDIPLAAHAIRAGAVDFIQKPFNNHVLLERIQEALAVDRENRRLRALAGDLEERLSKLTERELEIMKLLAAGESTKQIAGRLAISPKTVDNHRAKILEKMNVENPTQLSRLLSMQDSKRGPPGGRRPRRTE